MFVPGDVSEYTPKEWVEAQQTFGAADAVALTEVKRKPGASVTPVFPP
ncbi:hypothetical protein [Luteibacter rhizovicinus]|nr:hypothetical protein [Luteibacter rhizovicinus]